MTVLCDSAVCQFHVAVLCAAPGQMASVVTGQGSSSSSSSVTATAINKLIILSLLKGRLALQKKQQQKNKKTYVAGLEAFDTKVSMVVASTVVWGRLFQSWIVRGRNDCC